MASPTTDSHKIPFARMRADARTTRRRDAREGHGTGFLVFSPTRIASGDARVVTTRRARQRNHARISDAWIVDFDCDCDCDCDFDI